MTRTRLSARTRIRISIDALTRSFLASGPTVYVDRHGSATTKLPANQDGEAQAEADEPATPQAPPLIRWPRGISPTLQAAGETVPPIRQPRG